MIWNINKGSMASKGAIAPATTAIHGQVTHLQVIRANQDETRRLLTVIVLPLGVPEIFDRLGHSKKLACIVSGRALTSWEQTVALTEAMPNLQ